MSSEGQNKLVWEVSYLATVHDRVMSHDVKWREFINTNGEVPERILLKSAVEDAEHSL